MYIAKLTKWKRDTGGTDLIWFFKTYHFWQILIQLLLLKKCLQHFFYLKEQVRFHFRTYSKKHSSSVLLAIPHLLKREDKRLSCLKWRVWNTDLDRKKFDNCYKSWTHCRDISQNSWHAQKKEKEKKKIKYLAGFEPMTYRIDKPLKNIFGHFDLKTTQPCI